MQEDEDVLGGGQGFHEDGDEFLDDPLGPDLDLDLENEDDDFDKDH